MTDAFTLLDFEEATGRLRTAQSRRHFSMHTTLYIVTNVVLIVLNLAIASSFPWALLPIVLWGIILGAHYCVAFRWRQRENAQWIAQAEYLAGELHRANEIPMRKVA